MEENWRGAYAWTACERELSAKGETLDWQRFVPPPIPDEQNLAMAPLFVHELFYAIGPKTHVYTFGPADKRPQDLLDMPFAGPKPSGIIPGGWELARHLDLPFYQKFYREKAGFPHGDAPQTPADDVLLGLSRYSPTLDELAQAAAQRPLTRFPVYWQIDNPYMTTLPHYNLEQQLVRTLTMRASARLAAGHEDDALRDLELGWRLSDDMGKDSVLIANLVQITCVGISLTPVWEGLADRRWSSAELTRLQADLQRIDLLTSLAAMFRGERAYELRGINYMESHRDLAEFVAINGTGERSETSLRGRLAYDAIPRGWFDFNKVAIARYMQNYLVEAIDPEAHRLLLDKLDAGVRARAAWPFWYTNILARLTVPIFDGIPRRSARLQTGVDEAVTACALERFFLDHHAYPDRLDALVPNDLAHVPTDVIGGAPLRYRTTPDGRYLLYGVGWNGRDDGGTVAWDTPGRLRDSEGDWVWQYSELQPPPPAR